MAATFRTVTIDVRCRALAQLFRTVTMQVRCDSYDVAIVTNSRMRSDVALMMFSMGTGGTTVEQRWRAFALTWEAIKVAVKCRLVTCEKRVDRL